MTLVCPGEAEGEKQLASKCILKRELTTFTKRLDMEGKGKEGARMIQISWLEHEVGGTIYRFMR